MSAEARVKELKLELPPLAALRRLTPKTFCVPAPVSASKLLTATRFEPSLNPV